MAKIPDYGPKREKYPGSKNHVARYFQLTDKDPGFERIKIALKIGLPLSTVTAVTSFCMHYRAAPSMAHALHRAGRLFGLGIFGSLAHAGTVATLGNLTQKDSPWNHFFGGMISGFVMKYNTVKGPMKTCFVFGFFSMIFKCLTVYDVKLLPHPDTLVSKELGVTNFRTHFTLNHQYMNPQWKVYEEDLDKYL